MTTRILQIVADLDWAGAQRQMSQLALRLPSADFEVHVCALGRGGPLGDDLARAGIPVETLDRRWSTDPRAFARLYRLVERLRPALIHTWQTSAHAWGCGAARLAGVRRFVMTQHRRPTGLGLLTRWQLRQVAARADAIVVNSPATGEWLVGHGWPAARLQTIANGVPAAGRPSTTRDQLLSELGLPPESRLIGFAGRLVERKRLKDAIWAADLVKVIRDDAHLLLIGSGPHYGRLLRFRDQVVICDKVHFLGPRSDLARLLPHLDAYWSTSAAEGQSMATLEAMAAGVPVVATDIPGTRDLVVGAPGDEPPETTEGDSSSAGHAADQAASQPTGLAPPSANGNAAQQPLGEPADPFEPTGFLVPLGHRAGFARYTNQILDDASLATRLAAAARRRAAALFPLEQMLAQYAACYRSLLG